MEPNGYASPRLDAVFGALADPTRRAILVRLTEGPAPVRDLAQPFAMSQPAVSKHLKVLEQAGLIRREAEGAKRLARLEAARMAEAAFWLTRFRAFWEGSLDQLDALLTDLQSEEDSPDDR